MSSERGESETRAAQAPASEAEAPLLGRVGEFSRAAVRASVDGIVASYRAVDPDVRRHLAVMPLLGLTMLSPRAARPEALADDGHRPVLFVHGLGGHPGNFLPARLYFRLHQRTRTYSFGLGGGALTEMAEELRRSIAAVCEVNGLRPGDRVDVVAHSMGGLVARLALDDEATRARVATLVTLGTPHGGTHAARFAATEYTRALRPDSEIILRLAQQLPWRGPPRLVSFWSAADVLLLPASTACVDGAENVELPGATHYSYLLQPACFARVMEALTAA